MGSFGAVWAADDSQGRPLAVKEILCGSHADLSNALFEGHLLGVLGGPRQGRGSLPVRNAQGLTRLPRLVACETVQLASDQWRIRLAMTRLFGEPLDTFLKRRQEQLRVSSSAAACRRRLFGKACRFARALLVQLAPAFEEIGAAALHRDVNAHNILIECVDDAPPQFGLVDFGLAVDIHCWQQSEEEAAAANGASASGGPARPSRVGQDGASTWHHLDVGGDCRYWPVSAWVQFLLGWTELEAHPPLRFEYQTQLDLHSLGLTALQVLVEMLPPVDGDQPGGAGGALSSASQEDDDPFMREIHVLQLAWGRYWSAATPLHSRLMDTFHNGGDWDALKTECLEADVHGLVADHLREIRAALADAREACDRARLPAEATGTEGASGLLSALLLLISAGEGGSCTAGEVGHGPARWREVSLALAAGDGCTGGPGDCGGSGWGSAEGASSSSTAAAGTASPFATAAPSVASTATTLGWAAAPAPAPAPVLHRKAGHMAPPTPPPSMLPHAACGLSQGPRSSSPHSSAGDSRQQGPIGDDIVLRLSHLRDRVDWLAQEMARLQDSNAGTAPGAGFAASGASCGSGVVTPMARSRDERVSLG